MVRREYFIRNLKWPRVHPSDINKSKGGHVHRFFWSNALRTKLDGLSRPAAITDLSTVLARGIPNSISPITVSISNGLIQLSLNVEIRTNSFCFTDAICFLCLSSGQQWTGCIKVYSVSQDIRFNWVYTLQSKHINRLLQLFKEYKLFPVKSFLSPIVIGFSLWNQ